MDAPGPALLDEDEGALPAPATVSPAHSSVATRVFPAFPFTPYPIQLQLMRGVYATLARRGVGVFESPTGTGKTLSLLVAALTWQADADAAEAAGADLPAAEEDESGARTASRPLALPRLTRGCPRSARVAAAGVAGGGVAGGGGACGGPRGEARAHQSSRHARPRRRLLGA